MYLLGIRREDKNDYERRSPLVPDHVAQLARQHQVQVVLQPAPRRIFTDDAYRAAGAPLDEDLDACPLIMGIKEIPLARLLPGKAYVFFSHTIKGQPYNMPLLRRLMELGCTLIDYERITDDLGRRLVFFGRHAGVAGMIDTLWALGQRLLLEGYQTPLATLEPAHQYPGLRAAKEVVHRVGQALHRQGLPRQLRPLTFGITGYGNVSGGAQEILDLLGVEQVEPKDLAHLDAGDGPLVKVVFREKHLVEPLRGAFHLQEYYERPDQFRQRFHRYLPQLSVVVNCIYWAPRYPRLITRDQLAALYGGDATPRLRVIGDITCDVEGSIEATLKSTEPNNPVFVYDVERGQAVDGVAGRGPVIMAVENLPAELPREASETFSTALMPFIPRLARADFDADQLQGAGLPPELERATICYRGALTEDYQYLSAHLQDSEANGEQ